MPSHPPHRLPMAGLHALLLVLGAVVLAHGDTLSVPRDHSTIQDAIDAAAPGDEIRVGPGDWCGAQVTKPVHLAGEGGPRIVGCETSPAPALPQLRAGFWLSPAGDGAASGTTIRHFVFDGAGVSDDHTEPLSFAVFARDTDDVAIEYNQVLGTVQAITNTNGGGWTIRHNRIQGFTSFVCDAFCGGGDAIVLQRRTTSGARASGSTVSFNTIEGAVPAGLDEFSMVGILVLGAEDGTVIRNNRVALAPNPEADGVGQAIVLTNHCCGVATSYLTVTNSVVVNNDGRGSEFSLVIELQVGGASGNEAGAVLRGNLGVNDVNGSGPATVRNRSIRTLLEFP